MFTSCIRFRLLFSICKAKNTDFIILLPGAHKVPLSYIVDILGYARKGKLLTSWLVGELTIDDKPKIVCLVSAAKLVLMSWHWH